MGPGPAYYYKGGLMGLLWHCGIGGGYLENSRGRCAQIFLCS